MATMLRMVPKSFLSDDFVIFVGPLRRGQISVRRPFWRFFLPFSTTLAIDGMAYEIRFLGLTKNPGFSITFFDNYALYLGKNQIAYARARQVANEIAGVATSIGKSYLVEYQESVFEIGSRRKSLEETFMASPRIAVFENSAETDGITKQIGTMYHPHRMSREKVIDLPDRLPTFLKVFFYWLSRDTGYAYYDAGP